MQRQRKSAGGSASGNGTRRDHTADASSSAPRNAEQGYDAPQGRREENGEGDRRAVWPTPLIRGTGDGDCANAPAMPSPEVNPERQQRERPAPKVSPGPEVQEKEFSENSELDGEEEEEENATHATPSSRAPETRERGSHQHHAAAYARDQSSTPQISDYYVLEEDELIPATRQRVEHVEVPENAPARPAPRQRSGGARVSPDFSVSRHQVPERADERRTLAKISGSAKRRASSNNAPEGPGSRQRSGGARVSLALPASRHQVPERAAEKGTLEFFSGSAEDEWEQRRGRWPTTGFRAESPPVDEPESGSEQESGQCTNSSADDDEGEASEEPVPMQRRAPHRNPRGLRTEEERGQPRLEFAQAYGYPQPGDDAVRWDPLLHGRRFEAQTVTIRNLLSYPGVLNRLGFKLGQQEEEELHIRFWDASHFEAAPDVEDQQDAELAHYERGAAALQRPAPEEVPQAILDRERAIKLLRARVRMLQRKATTGPYAITPADEARESHRERAARLREDDWWERNLAQLVPEYRPNLPRQQRVSAAQWREALQTDRAHRHRHGLNTYWLRLEHRAMIEADAGKLAAFRRQADEYEYHQSSHRRRFYQPGEAEVGPAAELRQPTYRGGAHPAAALYIADDDDRNLLPQHLPYAAAPRPVNPEAAAPQPPAAPIRTTEEAVIMRLVAAGKQTAGTTNLQATIKVLAVLAAEYDETASNFEQVLAHARMRDGSTLIRMIEVIDELLITASTAHLAQNATSERYYPDQLEYTQLVLLRARMVKINSERARGILATTANKATMKTKEEVTTYLKAYVAAESTHQLAEEPERKLRVGGSEVAVSVAGIMRVFGTLMNQHAELVVHGQVGIAQAQRAMTYHFQCVSAELLLNARDALAHKPQAALRETATAEHVRSQARELAENDCADLTQLALGAPYAMSLVSQSDKDKALNQLEARSMSIMTDPDLSLQDLLERIETHTIQKAALKNTNSEMARNSSDALIRYGLTQHCNRDREFATIFIREHISSRDVKAQLQFCTKWVSDAADLTRIQANGRGTTGTRKPRAFVNAIDGAAASDATAQTGKTVTQALGQKATLALGGLAPKDRAAAEKALVFLIRQDGMLRDGCAHCGKVGGHAGEAMCSGSEAKHLRYHVNAVSALDADQCRLGTRGEMRCFTCDKPGHFARECTTTTKGGAAAGPSAAAATSGRRDGVRDGWKPGQRNTCFNCGRPGHRHYECPQRPCHNCEQPGHSSQDCTQPKRRRQSGGWDKPNKSRYPPSGAGDNSVNRAELAREVANATMVQVRELLAQDQRTATVSQGHPAPAGWPPQTTHTDRQRSVAFSATSEDEQRANKRSKNGPAGNSTNSASGSR
jgi:Zinc knuckle